MAADTCIPAAALRHPGGCVVRAARAEIRNPGDWKWHELAVRLLSTVEEGHSLRNRRWRPLTQTPGDDPCQNIGIDIAKIRDLQATGFIMPPGDNGSRMFWHLIAHFSQRMLNLFTLVFQHQNFFKPVSECSISALVDRKGHSDFEYANAQLPEFARTQAEIGQSL